MQLAVKSHSMSSLMDYNANVDWNLKVVCMQVSWPTKLVL